MRKFALFLALLFSCLVPARLLAWKIPDFGGVVVANGTNVTVYLSAYNQDPQSPQARPWSLTIAAQDSIESDAQFVVLSKKYAADHERYLQEPLVSYKLTDANRFIIHFDNDKQEWFLAAVQD